MTIINRDYDDNQHLRRDFVGFFVDSLVLGSHMFQVSTFQVSDNTI